MQAERPTRAVRVPCKACEGLGGGCQTCGGVGHVAEDAQGNGKDGPPRDELPAQVAEIVMAWAEIEQRGVEGFAAMARESGERRELSEVCVDSVRVLGAEVNRLEFEREVDEALEEARRRKAEK